MESRKSWWQISKLHPLETLAVTSLVISYPLKLVADLSFYLPNGHSASFATQHYVLPLMLALALAAWATRRSGLTPAALLADVLARLRLVIAFTWIIYLHFNLKLWAQLLNPQRWDSWYQSVDVALSPVMQAISILHTPWMELTQVWPEAYHDIFVGMFLTSLAIHSIQARKPEIMTELVTVIALILIIGGFTYAIAPAWGPFIYESGTNPLATVIQSHMREFQQQFVTSHGLDYEGQNFVMALAAMPSLHIAHTYVLWRYAWHHIRWLGIVYLPLYLFIITEAVTAKWHYLLDIPLGLLLAVISIHIAKSLSVRHAAARKQLSQ